MKSFSWSDGATSGIEIIYLTDRLFEFNPKPYLWRVSMMPELIENTSVALKSPDIYLLSSQPNNNHN